MRRLYWMTSPTAVYRENCGLEWAQPSIDNLTTAFYKASNHLREVVELNPDFVEMIKIPEEVLDMITNIQMAKTWDDVVLHPFHDEGCEVCVLFGEA